MKTGEKKRAFKRPLKEVKRHEDVRRRAIPAPQSWIRFNSHRRFAFQIIRGSDWYDLPPSLGVGLPFLVFI